MAEATPRVEIDKNDAKGTPINQTTPPAKRRDAIGLLEIVLKNAINLPRFKSLIPGRYDMDPFAVISLGDKSFKTRFIYHSRNPVWNEHIYLYVKSFFRSK
jgi:phosphatidylserine decarboxylase